MKWRRQDAYALCGLLVWPLLYLCGAATTFQYADSAEFLTTAATGGVPHPPGYPVYTWLGWLAVKLWPGAVTTALAVLAAVITWVTLGGIFATLRALRCGLLASFLGASVAGVSHHLWKHATLPEAFALLGCFAAWLCYHACIAAMGPPEDAAADADARGRQVQARRRAWLSYALLAGLASAHHHTIILTLPIGVWLLWSLFRDDEIPRRGQLFVWGCVCFLLGLIPYVHLWWRGSASLVGSWGDIQGLGDALDHFLRREFGTFQSGLNDGQRHWFSHSLGYLKQSLAPSASFPFGLSVFWLLGMLFSVFAWRRRKEKSLPFALGGGVLAIWAAWCLSGLVFPVLLKMGTKPLDLSIVARFYLLPDVFLGIFAGLGIAWVLTLNTTKTPRMLYRYTLVLWLGLAAWWQYAAVGSHDKKWLETYARSLLREMPKGALLLEADNEAVCFGMNYLQHVLRLRRDVRFVCLPLLARKWYVKRLHREWPEFRYQWRPKRILSLAVIAHYARLKRPVHVTRKYSRSMQARFVWLPYGLSWQLLPPRTKSPTPEAVFARLHKHFHSLKRPGPLPDPTKHPWETTVAVRYALPWLYMAAILEQMKKTSLSKRSLAIAKRWIRTDKATADAKK